MNEFFVPGSVPATNAPGASATIRAEFANVAAAFDKLPVLAGNANELVAVNPSGTGLITSGFIISDLVTATGVQALTNKTLSWAGNTWVGFGTAATKTAGTGAGEVLLLAEANKLPALDAGNLVNLNVNTLGVVPVLHGGTGATTLLDAQVSLGINLKADANNAALTGAPVCPTPADGDNSAKIANTFFVNNAIAGVSGMTPSNSVPLVNGVGSPGISTQASRADHVHPSDTSKAPLASPAFTGNPTAPTPSPGDNDTSLATTAFVTTAVAAGGGVTLSNANPVVDGVAAPGVATTASRADHVHPLATAGSIGFTPTGNIAATNVQAALAELDTEKASLVSPALTGNPTAPTPATVDNDTSIATTAFVQAVVAAQPAGMSPSNNVPLINGTASAGLGVTGSRDDHVHPTDTTRASTSTLTAHTSNTSNPHSVTKAQVGLGSVDNTSDATKNSAVATLTNKTLDAANCKLGAVTGVLKATAGVFSAAAAGVDYVTPGGSLGTPTSGNLANCTFPTLNQNTTGTAANATNIADGAVSTAAKIAANVVGVVKLAREGTAGYVLTSGGAGADPSYAALPTSSVASVVGAFRNLQASANGTTADVSASADELVVESAGNAYQTLRAVSLTINTAGSGVNGLDAGALAASTWYALWVIWNGTTIAGLISTSATAPTMPSGYTHKARVGWIRTDASGNKYPLSFKQYGRRVQYAAVTGSNVPTLPTMASGVAGTVTSTTITWATAAVANFVPPSAYSIRLVLSNGAGNLAHAAPNNTFGGQSHTTNPSPINAANGTAMVLSGEFTLESSNVYYAANAAQCFLNCFGWEDNL